MTDYTALAGLIIAIVAIAVSLFIYSQKKKGETREKHAAYYISVQRTIIRFPDPNDATWDMNRDLSMIKDPTFEEELKRGLIPSRPRTLRADIEYFEKLKSQARSAIDTHYTTTEMIVNRVVNEEANRNPQSMNVGNTNIQQATKDALFWPVFKNQPYTLDSEISRLRASEQVKQQLAQMLPPLILKVAEHDNRAVDRSRGDYLSRREALLLHAKLMNQELKLCIQEQGKKNYRSQMQQ